MRHLQLLAGSAMVLVSIWFIKDFATLVAIVGLLLINAAERDRIHL